MKRSWIETPTHYVLNSFSQETIFRFSSHEITMERMKVACYFIDKKSPGKSTIRI